MAPVEYDHLASSKKEEASAVIRERVQAAREIQQDRFRGTGITCNARITSDIIREVCPISEDGNRLLKNVFEKMGLSARAYDRIVKVSRTIADMDRAKVIGRNILQKQCSSGHWTGNTGRSDIQ